MLNPKNYIKYCKDGIPVIEGPFDSFRLEARIHELDKSSNVTDMVVTKGCLEQDRDDYMSGVGFTD